MWVFIATAAELLYTKSQVRDIQDASYVCLSYHITSEGVYNNNNNKKVGEKEEKKNRESQFSVKATENFATAELPLYRFNQSSWRARHNAMQ